MRTRRPVRCLATVSLAALLVACGTTVDSPATQTGGLSAGSGSAGLTGSAAPAAGGVAEAPAGSAAEPGTTGGGVPGPEGPVEGAVASTGSAGEPVASGATGNRGPVKVGLIYTYNDDAAASAGIDNGNTFTMKAAFNALVKAYNARGGVAGRRIVPVAVELSSNSTTLSSDLQAACSRFTQDEHVVVVLSAVGLFSETFSQCLSKAGTPQITGDYALGDETAVARIPTLMGPATLDVDNREIVLLQRMTALGHLRSTDRLGVVVEGCPYNIRAYQRTVEPLAKRLGVPVAQHIESRCFEGINDLGGLASDMQSAVLRFQTNGITHVAFVSGSVEGNAMFLFATAAESQSYRPSYLLTSAAVAAVQEANTPKSQLAKAFGIGWLPSIDSTRTALTGPAGRECLSDLKTGGGITPQSAADRYYAASGCDVLSLYDAALRSSRGATDARAVLSAVHGLGGGFAAASAYGEKTDFRGGRRTGAAQGRVFAWSTGCGCFDYTGGPFPLV